ncbi:MAG: hypothetical protein HYV27_12345 [Candidatus Hydrogenedentes bacterium]|nr:hypothetical protein [Candidatus Hydrogenedentota bacterium]
MFQLIQSVPWRRGGLAFLVLVLLASSCATTGQAVKVEQEQGDTGREEQIQRIRKRLMLWVKGYDYDPGGRPVILNPGGAIKRYDWEEPNRVVERYTRVQLVKLLVDSYTTHVLPAQPAACVPTVEACLRALEKPMACTPEVLQRWTGIHKNLIRDAPAPDDAQWEPPRWNEPGQFWEQKVAWQGEAPRFGWNRCDTEGLYGWDPKISGEGATSDDGQSGVVGTNVGYPVDLDATCGCIVWISPKEAYLECINGAGLRTAAGLKTGHAWQVEALP